MATPAKRRNLSQVIAASILDQIRAGEIGVGDRLPTEAGLMERYEVGRNAVREAVQQLVAMGVVDVRPGRGTTVVGIGADDLLDTRMVSALLEDQTVADLYAFRMLLEVEIAAAAATHADDDETAAIARASADFDRRLADREPVYRADLAFHRAIALASGNAIYLRVLDALADILAASRELTDHVPGSPERASREHNAIVEAIRSRDAETARACMRTHIEGATASIERARAASSTSRREAFEGA